MAQHFGKLVGTQTLLKWSVPAVKEYFVAPMDKFILNCREEETDQSNSKLKRAQNKQQSFLVNAGFLLLCLCLLLLTCQPCSPPGPEDHAFRRSGMMMTVSASAHQEYSKFEFHQSDHDRSLEGEVVTDEEEIGVVLEQTEQDEIEESYEFSDGEDILQGAGQFSTLDGLYASWTVIKPDEYEYTIIEDEYEAPTSRRMLADGDQD
jgi:hypothetical protein